MAKGEYKMTVRASCPKCNMIAHYFPPITLQQIQKCLPFSCLPKDPDDCDHEWIIKEIENNDRKS